MVPVSVLVDLLLLAHAHEDYTRRGTVDLEGREKGLCRHCGGARKWGNQHVDQATGLAWTPPRRESCSSAHLPRLDTKKRDYKLLEEVRKWVGTARNIPVMAHLV